MTALLDAQTRAAQQGVPCPVPAGDDERLAIDVWNLLHNGMGGLDMGQGFQRACAYFRVRDVRGLIDRLRVIKHHKLPDEARKPAAPAARELLPRSLQTST
jgi:hypothetical protein